MERTKEKKKMGIPNDVDGIGQRIGAPIWWNRIETWDGENKLNRYDKRCAT